VDHRVHPNEDILMAQLTEDTFRRLKAEVEETKAEADRAKGALDHLLKRLQVEFDCENLREAATILKELKKEKDKVEADFNSALAQYEHKWKGGDELGS